MYPCRGLEDKEVEEQEEHVYENLVLREYFWSHHGSEENLLRNHMVTTINMTSNDKRAPEKVDNNHM